jgi:amino acid transporter
MMSHTSTEQRSLKSGQIGTWGIVFMVISAAAPLTVVAGSFPAAFAFGGIGVAGAMLFAGFVLLAFASGFTAMGKYVRNAGAFYAYAGRGLGKPVGVGVSLVTIVSYLVLSISFYGLIGFFGNLAGNMVFSVDLPWWVYSIVALAAIFVLGRRQVEFGARVLGVLLTLEVSVVLVLIVSILVQGGPEPISAAPIDPANFLFAPGAGVLFVFAFGAFLGFEGTAVYAEEARNPERSIPRATYGAVAFLGLFYALAAYMMSYGFGFNGIIDFVTTQDFTTLPFAVAGTFAGDGLVNAMLVLIVTSFFACLLAFHNASARYMYSLGRERLLPRSLAKVADNGAPVNANTVLVIIAGLAIAATIVMQGDPYVNLAIGTYAAGTSGLVFAQAIASIAVVAFFIRDRRGHSIWRVLVFPLIGAAGLITGWSAIVANFDVLTGWGGNGNVALIVIAPALLIAGIVWALVIKSRDAKRYEHLIVNA